MPTKNEKKNPEDTERITENENSNPNDDNQSNDSEEEYTMEEKIAQVLNKKAISKNSFGDLISKDDDLMYDLGNLLAVDTHSIDLEKYKYVYLLNFFTNL